MRSLRDTISIDISSLRDEEILERHLENRFLLRIQFYSIQVQRVKRADVGCENCHGAGGNCVKNPQKGYGQVTDEKSFCYINFFVYGSDTPTFCY